MDYRVTGSELTTVADAIRQKGGTSEKLVWPNGFKSAVEDISGGSGITAEDEGKVVSNGVLVVQTGKSISSNGTHDTTTNNSVTVSVQPNLGTKTVSDAGTFSASSDGYDGFSEFTVSIPNADNADY